MKTFSWTNTTRNDAYEPDVFEQAEAQISSEGFCWDNGKPMTGMFGYEASLNRVLDDAEANRSAARTVNGYAARMW